MSVLFLLRLRNRSRVFSLGGPCYTHLFLFTGNINTGGGARVGRRECRAVGGCYRLIELNSKGNGTGGFGAGLLNQGKRGVGSAWILLVVLGLRCCPQRRGHRVSVHCTTKGGTCRSSYYFSTLPLVLVRGTKRGGDDAFCCLHGVVVASLGNPAGWGVLSVSCCRNLVRILGELVLSGTVAGCGCGCGVRIHMENGCYEVWCMGWANERCWAQLVGTGRQARRDARRGFRWVTYSPSSTPPVLDTGLTVGIYDMFQDKHTIVPCSSRE